MKVKNYKIETLSGAPIYTSGRSLSVKPTPSHTRPFTSTEPNERMLAYWGKKIGEPVRAVEAGMAEIMFA